MDAKALKSLAGMVNDGTDVTVEFWCASCRSKYDLLVSEVTVDVLGGTMKIELEKR